MNLYNKIIIEPFFRLKIRQKIFLIFFIIFVFFVIAAVTTLQRQNKSEALTNEVIKYQIPYIRKLLNLNISIEQLLNNISFFLLSNNKIYEEETKLLIQYVVYEFSILHKTSHQNETSLQSDPLYKNLKLLEIKIIQLLDLSKDPVRRYPGIHDASKLLRPLNQQINSTINLMLNDFNVQGEEIKYTLQKDALYELRYSWSQYINSFRLFMATRTLNNRNNLKDYSAAVKQKLVSFTLIIKKSPDIFNFHIDNINKIKNTLDQFFSSTKNVIKLFDNDKWRSDIYYLNTEIVPLINNIKDSLQTQVNAELELATLTSTNLIDANSLQKSIMITLVLSIIGLSTFMALFFSKHITDRLHILMSATHKATEGNLDVDFKLQGQDELSQLGHDFLIMTKSLKEKTRELEAQKVALDQHNIVSITDNTGLITYVNQKFCDISGYKATELIGRCHNVITSGVHDKELWKDMWRSIEQGHVWHADIRNQKKDSSYYWVNTTIVPFLDEKNKPYQYVSMCTDITARKESKAELLKLNDELEQRVENRTQALETAMHGLEYALKDVEREKQAIQAIVSGTTTASGENFYLSLVENAAKTLNMEYVILATYSDTDISKSSIKSMWAIDRPGDNVDYDLISTCCEHLIGNETLIVEENIAQKFTNEAIFIKLEVESCIGIPIFDSKGMPLGYLLAMSKKSINKSGHYLKLAKIFATRAASELEIQRTNNLLKIRLEQQSHIAQLSQLALSGSSLENLFNHVVTVLKSSLHVEFSKILQYRKETNDFLLVAGSGWQDGDLLQIMTETYNNTQAGYTLEQDDVVIVADYSTETRFESPPLLKDHHVKSGMSTVIADTRGSVFGVIGVHSTKIRHFSEDDIRLLNTVGQILTLTTARLNAEERLEYELQVQSIISYLSQLVFLNKPLKELLSYALEMILSLNAFGETAMACICLIDEHNTALQVTATYGINDTDLNLLTQTTSDNSYTENISLNQHFKFTPASERKSVTKLNSSQDHNEYSVPISYKDKLLGVLNIYTKCSKRECNQNNAFLTNVAITLTGIIELKYAEDALAIAYRHKSEFLSTMSHELRTPLNSIIGFSKAMLKGIDGPINNEQNESLLHIHKSGQHLLEIIGNILDISKMEAGKMELYYSDVDITEMMNDVIKSIRIQADEKNLLIKLDIDEELPRISCDKTRIKQVILNIASNAVKFTEKGSIEFHCHHLNNINIDLDEKIKEHIESTRFPFLIVSIKDTGIGITNKDKPKIFEEFSQVDNSSTRKHTGTGLGMTISKKLIEMHGGMMWSESTFEKGSTFYFIIPLQQPGKE